MNVASGYAGCSHAEGFPEASLSLLYGEDEIVLVVVSSLILKRWAI